MILDKKDDLEVVSTLSGDDIDMTIDENAMVHLMGILTDLYTDPELACIREYSTNARDANIEAGNDTPIEVYTPNKFSPSLKIIDHGVGLDAASIRNIYSKYGASTKRESNEYNGVLGLGCKSALTYTNQFTVTGIKDGVRTVVAVSRNEDGAGVMTVLDERVTEDDNGVTIEIPAKPYDGFSRKAQTFFSYWPEGSVLLNGEPVKRVEGVQITDEILLVKEPGDDMLVMGGVSYPISSTKTYNPSTFGIDTQYHVVCFAPMGSVHFTPSRESLQDTKKTKGVLAQYRTDFTVGFERSINKEIDKANSPMEGLRIGLAWLPAIRNGRGGNLSGITFKYRGQEIPRTFASPDGETYRLTTGQKNKDAYGKRKGVGRASQHNSIDWVRLADSHFIYNHTDNFTPTHKHKLWQWYEEQGMDLPQNYVLCHTKPNSMWIDKSRCFDWGPISKIKLARNVAVGGPRKKIRGSYPAWVNGDHVSELEAQDIDTSKPLFWQHPSDGIIRGLEIFYGLEPYTVVQLTGNRESKFLREFPMAIKAGPHVRELAQDWWDLLSLSDRIALTSHDHKNTLYGVPIDVADPRIRRLKYPPVADVRLHREFDKVKYLIHTRIPDKDKVSFFERDYPMIACHQTYGHRYGKSGTMKEHYRAYINAIYQEKNNVSTEV